MVAFSFSAISQRDTLIYIGDPMCSWCYGFTSELDKITDYFPSVPLMVIVGGLRPGGTESFGELKDFLSKHWSEVEEVSGQPFNHGILENAHFVYNTEPACRSVMTMNHFNPDLTYEYFKRIQKGFYYYNQWPGDPFFYGSVAQALNVEKNLFISKMESEDMKNTTRKSFEWAASLGVRSFPTLMAKINGQWVVISQGYQKAEKMIPILKRKGIQ